MSEEDQELAFRIALVLVIATVTLGAIGIFRAPPVRLEPPEPGTEWAFSFSQDERSPRISYDGNRTLTITNCKALPVVLECEGEAPP